MQPRIVKILEKRKRVKMRFLLVSTIIYMSLGFPVHAVTPDYDSIFLKTLRGRRVKAGQFGLSVFKKSVKGTKYEVVYERNPFRYFTPASVTKVVTAAGLMKETELGYQIPTEIWGDQKPKGELYEGNLYLRGQGDPTMVSERLWLLVNEIRKWGIRRIEGNIYLDDYAFDDKALIASRNSWNQRAYNASVTALALNWNSVRVRFVDSENMQVVTDPENPYFKISKVKKSSRKPSQASLKKQRGKEVVSVSFGKDAINKEKSLYRRVSDPSAYFGSQLSQLLKEAGISHEGTVIKGHRPKQAFLVGEIKSRPLSYILSLMMKYSNNFIADTLTKHLAFLHNGEGASFGQGIRIIRNAVRGVYPFGKGFVYGNASGLGRENKLSPREFNQFLIALRKEPFFPEFMASLPISCVDGTLKDRICKRKGYVRAKTGMLAGVAGLAGYGKNRSGDEFVFTMFFNGKNHQQFDGKDAIDSFIEQIL